MRDYQEIIINFVEIVKRYPEVYDSGHDVYRTRYAELAWDKIAECVRTELKEECTVDEMKMKWKGIRSSYTRFLKKLKNNSDTIPCKKYYLYDSLKFLAPFTKSKRGPNESQESLQEISVREDSVNSDDDSVGDEFTNENMPDHWDVTIKSEAEDEDESDLNTNDILSVNVEDINDHDIDLDAESTEVPSVIDSISDDKAKKRKCEDAADIDTTDSEDLQFFKSILPDIKDFSVKEKRKLKMGILQLIDDIEDTRQQMRPDTEVTSSKMKRL